jgi:hypothetical protein
LVELYFINNRPKCDLIFQVTENQYRSLVSPNQK